MSINWFGAWTLFKKESWRFLKVYHQTLFSPVVNVILLLAIFSLSLGKNVLHVGEVPFPVFMSAGLIMMASMQNAFANSSSSFVMGKVLGNIIDYLIPPLGAFEILFSMVMASILRGLIVGLICYLVILFFVDISFFHPIYALFTIIMACMFLGLLGMLCGVVSESFDHMSAITSYLITPLTFLSGTFYSTNALPAFWQKVAHANPFFYMIDGFRYGITGYHDGDLTIGIIYMILINSFLWVILYRMIDKGYRIKS